MHIIQLGKYYPPHLGGIENNTRQCAQALAGEHRVTALVFNDKPKREESKDGDVDVVRLRSFGRVSSQELCFGMGRELHRLKPDIVHLHAPNPLAMVAYRMYTPDVPLVITHHTDMVRQRVLRRLFLPLYQKLVKECASLVVYTRKYFEDCDELPRLGREPEIIPNGTEVPDYLESEEFLAQAAEKRRKQCGDAPLLCFIGRFVKYKGLEHLVRALAKCPGVHAVLAGSGPELNPIRELVTALDLDGRVSVPGPVSGRDKWVLLQASDFVVLPSINGTESFGQFLVETQLCAKPAVVTNIPGGVTEVILPGKTGLAVKPGDDIELAGAILKLASDTALRRELGQAGRTRAGSLFTRAAVDGKLRDLFNRVAVTHCQPRN